MSDVEELYQRVIMTHARNPRNERAVEGVRAERYNPLCGDEVVVTVRRDGERIAEVGAVAQGCALSKAAASMMTIAVEGLTPDAARAVYERFRGLLAGGEERDLGDLASFASVAKFPSRARCATLAWQALLDALGG